MGGKIDKRVKKRVKSVLEIEHLLETVGAFLFFYEKRILRRKCLCILSRSLLFTDSHNEVIDDFISLQSLLR